MARPSNNTETKQKLLDQGLISFIHNGFHGTGLKEVLDYVKVPKGSFYNYFSSKDDYVAQVIDLYSDRLTAAWDGLFQNYDGRILDGIKQLFNVLVSAHNGKGHTDGCLVGNLAAEVGDTNELLRQTLYKRMTEWQQRLTDQLQIGQERGEIRNDLDAADLSAFFWDAWQGSLLRMKVEQSISPLKRTLTFLIDDFLPARHEPE